MDASVLEEVFTGEELDRLIEKDPSLGLLASANWQDPTTFASTYFGPALYELTSKTGADGKLIEIGRQQIQAECWKIYRTFGPINASVNSKADYVTGEGFSLYSNNLKINRFLVDLVFSRRNRLYAALNGWMVRMQAEGELFLLLSFDETGQATIRVLEPGKICGSATLEDGLLCHPDDVTQTLFYEYKFNNSGFELIPDINLMFDPGLLKIAKDIPGFDIEKTERSRDHAAAFRSLGGYRRFILHWKNLTGIHEYRRDTSHLRTVLEAINLYWTAIKWELDHKKAQAAYTIELSFEDTPFGRTAWQVWNKMSDEERAKTGLTKTLTPGSRVFTMPGLALIIHSPQLSKMSGQNQDLLNIAGAGARSPQDLFQGQVSGATHASLKSTRPPLVQEVKNLGTKFKHFLTYDLLRACFFAKSKMSDFPETFSKKFTSEIKDGKPVFETLEVEPCELVKISLPNIILDERTDKKASAFLGSKHGGLESLGVSHGYIAEEMGVGDLARQIRLKFEEEQESGKRDLSRDPEKAAENNFVEQGLEENPEDEEGDK